jgi:hypothetical protein
MLRRSSTASAGLPAARVPSSENAARAGGAELVSAIAPAGLSGVAPSLPPALRGGF